MFANVNAYLSLVETGSCMVVMMTLHLVALRVSFAGVQTLPETVDGADIEGYVTIGGGEWANGPLATKGTNHSTLANSDYLI